MTRTLAIPLPDTLCRAKPTPKPFQYNHQAIRRLFFYDMYSRGGETVFRECLQNSVDANTAARREGIASDVIEAEILPLAGGGWQFSITDEGIGVHPDEAERCFATIGESTKAGDASTPEDTFLGRFGIGLLGDHPAVPAHRGGRHRAVRVEPGRVAAAHPGQPQAPAFRWTGRSDGTWWMERVSDDLEAGTRVFLRLPPEWDPERVYAALRMFGRFLRGRIIFRSPNGERKVNATPPWNAPMPEDEMLRLGEELFDEAFAGAFSFNDPVTSTRGLAYVVKRAVPPGAQLMHRLYVRGMLVGEKIRGFAPAFAPFIRVLVNSEMLRVNAAREDLHGEEDRMESVRESVGSALMQWLANLATTEPQRAEEIVAAQYETMLAGVEAGHSALLPHLRHTLPLHTSIGTKTFDQIVRRFGHVEFLDSEREWHRVEIKARQEGHCLVRADYRSTHQLLVAVRRFQPETRVAHLTAAEYLAKFASEIKARGAEEQRLIERGIGEFKAEACLIDFFDGEDPYELAMLEMQAEASILRHLKPSEDVDPDDECPAKTLRLNSIHPLVEQLLASADLPDEQVRAWLRMAYHGALLSAREMPTGGENRRHARALLTLFKATGVF